MPLLGCVTRVCLAGGGGLGFPQDAGALSWGSEGGRPCGSGPHAHAGSACSSCQPHPGPEGMYQRLGRVVSECEDGVRLRGRAALPADRLEQADCGECPVSGTAALDEARSPASSCLLLPMTLGRQGLSVAVGRGIHRAAGGPHSLGTLCVQARIG